MRISIITVCYNSSKTVADTIRSVAEQDHADVEHIVVDGASSDDTLEIVRALSSRPPLVVSEPDAGIYDAMNKGFGLATGEFVGFLNADDMLAGPEVLSRIAKAASQHGIDAVYGDLSYVQQDRTERTVRYWQSGDFTAAKLRHGWMPPHPTFYVRRALVQEIGRFDLQFRIAADYDFMLRVLGRAGVRTAYIPEVLVRMRVGGASNRSLRAILKKSREDLVAIRKNRVGGLATLFCKNARKLPQFLLGPRREPPYGHRP